jgi:preprotein translocase subunit SecA
MTSLFSKIFGDASSKFLKEAGVLVKEINSLEEKFTLLANEDFPKKTQEFKEKLAQGSSLDDILPEAFALVREASRRNLGERHYDVQLIGGLALHRGKVVEMKTGEGKTLVATLPAYLNSLIGKGVHIITVNDYLARRDAVLMGQIYNFLGLTVGVINSENVSYLYAEDRRDDLERDKVGEYKIVYDFLKTCSRAEAYQADITYGTNHEYGFDYLRDNLVTNKKELVQREHAFAIVDEVDSILIDEARTPLIISSTSDTPEDFYVKFCKIAGQLKKDLDYEVDEKLRAITLTDQGISKAEELLGIKDIYTEKGIKYVHHLEIAIKAKAIFEKDKDYVVQEGEVVIVDSFTGRLQPGRRWSEGIHQAIEAKEGVNIKKETRSSGSITFQNYFRFYTKLAGMTGTAETSSEEFFKVYGLEVVVVPTHRPMIRLDNSDLIFQTEKGKYQAIAKKVKELNLKKQPVLIGTISVEKNELLSAYLRQEGIKHVILNAKNHEKEGEIIAQAGKSGAVTIATNMAGRGIDIKLGGNPHSKEEYELVKNAGGLFVMGTERHEARRIDNQLRGRSGRQGDPGETQFYISLDDDLMRIFGSEKVKSLMGRFGIPEDQPIENSFITKQLEGAQAKIEGFHFDARKHILEYDDLMNHQRKIIYERRQKMIQSDEKEIEKLLEILKSERPDLEKIISEKIEKLGDKLFWGTTRRIILYVTDILWMEHLEAMDHLRSSVNLRAYGQREPIVEYKREGLKMFKEMEINFREQLISLIKTINIEEAKRSLIDDENSSMPLEIKNIHEHEASQKLGRNDLCSCGSGKKFKKCCGS